MTAQDLDDSAYFAEGPRHSKEYGDYFGKCNNLRDDSRVELRSQNRLTRQNQSFCAQDVWV